MRQIDVAAHHGGAFGADRRNGEPQRRPDRGPAFRDDVRVPAVHKIDLSVENRAGQRAAWREVPLWRLAAGDGEALPGTTRSGWARALSELLSLSALGRDAAARRDRAGTGAQTEDPADGRAVQRARRDDAGRTAGPAAEALDRPRADDPVRHARSRRGALRRPASHPAERVAGHDRGERRGATALPPAADRNTQRAGVPQAARASLPQHGRASDGRPGGRSVKAWSALRDSR